MRAAGPIKIILLLIGLGAVALIVSNILSRSSQQPAAQPSGPLLAPEVESRSTRFEYSEKEEGRTIFNVSAATSTLTKQGLQSLESPRLVLYDQEGEGFDTIEGRRGHYRIEEKRIEFLEDVRIQLADQTSIRSSKVQANLDENIIRIDQDFEFERGKARGSGRSLIYRIESRQLTARLFNLELPAAENPLQAWAEEAFYDIAGHRIRLQGQARMERAGGRLEASRIDVSLTSEQLLQRLESQGHVRFSPLSGQHFEGARMVKTFDPQGGRLLRLQVYSASSDSESPSTASPQPILRAAYQRTLPQGSERLVADRIEAQPSQQSEQSSHFALQGLVALGNVDFQSQPLSINRSSSQRFEAAFSPAQGDLESLNLQGEVEIERDLAGGQTQRLRSQELRVELLPAQVLRRVEADGPAHLETVAPGLERHLTARQHIHFDFEDGLLSRVQAGGGCQLESRSGDEVQLLQAPFIDFALRGGNPHLATAGGGVQIDLGGQSTTSRQLRLEYRQGKLFRAQQQGDFVLQDPSAGIDLRADQAVYDPSADQAVMGGPSGPYKLLYSAEPANPSARPSETLAGRFVVTRRQGRISELQAQGAVASRFEGQQSLLSVQAGAMSAQPGAGVIEYSQRPRVRQEGLSIVSDGLRLRQSDQSLEAWGSVESSFQDPDQPQSRTFSIAAGRLSFQPQQHKAHYEGDVRLETQDLKVFSPLMDVLLDETSRGVRQVAAWQGVVVHPDERRQIRGSRLAYDPSLDEVVITGSPAVLTDPEEGEASGTRLTFKVGSDSLHIGSPLGGSKP